MIEPDESQYCQMVTTVTRVGKSIYDAGAHGEAGATVEEGGRDVGAVAFGPQFLLFALLGPVTSGASWWQDRRRRHREEIARTELFGAEQHRAMQAIVEAMHIKPKGHDFNLKAQPVILRHMNMTGG